MTLTGRVLGLAWLAVLWPRDAAAARRSVILEIPHPLADRDSELAGAEAGAALHPAALLFAGAHRYADPRHRSDVAHTPLSVFEAVHEVLLEPGRVAVQMHGFSA